MQRSYTVVYGGLIAVLLVAALVASVGGGDAASTEDRDKAGTSGRVPATTPES